MSRFFLGLALGGILLLAPPAFAASSEPEAVSGEYIVKLSPSAAPQIAAAHAGSAAATASSLNSSLTLPSGYVIEDSRPIFNVEEQTQSSTGTPAIAAARSGASGSPLLVRFSAESIETLDPRQILAQLRQSPSVAWAEPNYIYHAAKVPSEPFFQSTGAWGQNYDDLWGLKKIDAEHAWDLSEGAGALVAVIDTGVDYNHPELSMNIWSNSREIAGNGVDDDGNGFIDDVRGWDFTTCTKVGTFGCSSSKKPDNDPMDGNGHGTHCSGIIAAAANGVGIVGVAPQAKIMPIKGLGDDGSGSLAELAAGVRYAVDNGADVISASWGGAGDSSLLKEVFAYAKEKGVIAVAAAGNDNSPVAGFVPAKLDTVISVASTDQNDEKSDFSNYSEIPSYGPTSGIKVDVAAPGGGSKPANDTLGKFYHVNILSLRSANTDMYKEAQGYTPGTFFVSDKGTTNNLYYRSRGTSMAAPFVSGLAALIVSKYQADHPGFERGDTALRRALRSEVRSRIIFTTDPLAHEPTTADGRQIYIGSGRINAYKALSGAASPHVAITGDRVEERSGNRNNIPESGEEVNLILSAQSQWGSVSSVQASLAAVAGTSAEVLKGDSEFGAIGADETKDNSASPFILRVGSVSYQTPVNLLLTLTIASVNGTTQQTIPIQVVVGARRMSTHYSPSIEQLFGDFIPPDFPSISDHRIVWSDSRNNNSDVYMYDFRTNEETLLSKKAGGGSHGGEQSHPSISGDTVAWQDNRNGNWDIYALNLAGGEAELLPSGTPANNQTQPVIGGRNILWTEQGQAMFLFNDLNIYNFNLDSQQLSALTSTIDAQFNPTASKDVMAWENSTLFGLEVVPNSRNLTQIVPFSPQGIWPIEPNTDGKRLVFADLSFGKGRDIFAATIDASGATNPVNLTNDVASQRYPHVSGDYAVWQEKEGDFWNIVLYQFSTNQRQVITHFPANNQFATIGGGYVAWASDNAMWITQLPGFSSAQPVKDPTSSSKLNISLNKKLPSTKGKKLVITIADKTPRRSSYVLQMTINKTLHCAVPVASFSEMKQKIQIKGTLPNAPWINNVRFDLYDSFGKMQASGAKPLASSSRAPAFHAKKKKPSLAKVCSAFSKSVK